jgi:hypothetical protein
LNSKILLGQRALSIFYDPRGKLAPTVNRVSPDVKTKGNAICQKNCLDVCVEFNKRKVELTAMEGALEKYGLRYA